MMNDISQDLREAVMAAAGNKQPLRIAGGDSKAFYGRRIESTPLKTAAHRGIVNYEPSEMVLTARAGTSLEEIEAALAESHQILGFEPPHFGRTATLGGAIATGLSGPRRPYAGAARDFVLGIRLLNGKGEILRFGGEVMKNVAGYDVSRLMTGALGLLGVILEVSLKVLPRPAVEQTLTQQCSAAEFIERVNQWAAKPYPISAACYDGSRLYLRLSGAGKGVTAAASLIGGEALENDAAFWSALREQRHPFFAGETPLWRLSVPPASPLLALPGEWLLDWGGAQRWLKTEASAEEVRRAAVGAGGHAMLFRNGNRTGQVFHPLEPVLLRLHRNLKQSFDPDNIFNPGRMYPEL